MPGFSCMIRTQQVLVEAHTGKVKQGSLTSYRVVAIIRKIPNRAAEVG